MVKFLDNYYILMKQQFGSTGHAILILISRIDALLDMIRPDVEIFVDLWKAFDTANDNIVLMEPAFDLRGKTYGLLDNHFCLFKQTLKSRFSESEV